MAMCAEGGSRTHMGVIPLRSERSASACSATSAIFLVVAILPRLVSLSTFQV